MASERKRTTIFNMLGGRCYYCGCELDFDNFHMDHFKAKKDGGKVHNNLVPACPECNLCKNDLTIEEFRRKVSFDLFCTFQGKMIRKYYGVGPRPVTFYFEEVQERGTV